jgi:serine/threonine protein kinase HipA of HipAB toxin-antitoxin module
MLLSDHKLNKGSSHDERANIRVLRMRRSTREDPDWSCHRYPKHATYMYDTYVLQAGARHEF